MFSGNSHKDTQPQEHSHTHGAVDPSLFTTQRGIWAIKWSFFGLIATALFQVVIVWLSGSVALLADTIHAVSHTAGVRDVSEVRVRWLGHRLHVELNIAVSPELSVEEGHEIANEVRHRLLHHLRYLSHATIHIDPMNASGEEYHRIAEHVHDNLPAHSH